MPILYRQTILPISGGTDIARFGGEVIVPLIGQQDLSIEDIVYNEFTSTLTNSSGAWVYSYLWNATIASPPSGSIQGGKTFSSNPTRFSLGHITIQEKFGVVDDFVWKFEGTRLPNYKAHFFEGEPNPGSFFPPIVPTPAEAVTYSYLRPNQVGDENFLADKRANLIGFFPTFTDDYVVKVTYFATLIFNANDILFNAPKVTLGLFP